MKSIKTLVAVVFIFVMVQLSMPLYAQTFDWYSQNDPAWASNRLGSTSQTVSGCTIGGYGCAMTSVAMLLQQESTDATTVTPASLNTYLTNNSGYQYSGGYALIVWSVAAQMDGSSGLTYYESNSVDDNWTYLDTQLAAGRKVIVQVDMYPATAPINDHWVVVYEKNGPSGQPSSYYINDPWPTTFPNPQRTLAYYYDSIYDNTFFESRVFAGNFSSSSGSISMVSGYPLSVYPTRTNPATAYFLPIEYQGSTPPEMDQNLAINFRITNSGSSSISLWNFGVEAKADNSSGANVFYCNYNQSVTLSPGQQVTFNRRAFITDQWNTGGSRNFYLHVTYQDDGGVWHAIPGTTAETNRTVYPRPSLSNSWLVKAPNNPAVFYYQNGYKWQLSSESTANALVPNWQTECYVYPTSTISGLSLPQTPSSNSTTPMMIGRNFVYKNPSTADVYIIEPEPGYSSPLVRRRFDSETAYYGYGYTSGSLSQLPVQLTSTQYNWVYNQWSPGSVIYPPSYSVNVTSSPSGASIYEGGSYSGYTTPHTFLLDQGSSATYTVQLSGYTWSPASFPVTNISSNQSVNFVGTPLTYTVDISSSPTDADIYVNGSDSGSNTPHTFTLNHGSSATYTVQKTGYTWSPTQFVVTNIQSNLNQNFTGTLGVPNAAVLSSPANGATGLPYSSQTLTWAAGSGNVPTGYKVYFGTVNPPTSLVSNQAGTTYLTPTLNPSTTYFWKVIAYNGTGDAPSSSIWSFTTAAISSYNVDITSSPSGAAVNVGGSSSGFTTPHIFTLTQGGSATYTVQLTGYTFTPSQFVVTNIQSNQSQDFVGSLNVPGAAVLSSPANGATGLAASGQTLVWAAGSGNPPSGYKVYLGTSNPPSALVSDQTGTSYLTGTLSPSASYFWKVVAYNGTGDGASSSIWSFSTATATAPPGLTSFQINNGASSTTSINVTLNNVASNATEYMASENSDFSGASWQTYSSAPAFTLSSSPGTKTVYFKVKNSVSESSSLSDQITLVLSGSSTLSGLVRTMGGTNLLPANAIVSIGGLTTSPNSVGNFSLSGIPAGVYSVTISLTNCRSVTLANVILSDGQTTNIGTIDLIQDPPYWTLLSGNQYTAIGFFTVMVDGNPWIGAAGQSGYNILGAFDSGGQCLGIGSWQDNFFYLDILSNTLSSTVYFKIYDGVSEEILTCDETVVYSDNALYGTPDVPIVLHVVTSASLTYNLVSGWNWVSIPLQFSNPALSTVFSSLGSSVSTVKTQTQSAIRSSGGTWYGTLTSITGMSSYLIQMNTPATLILEGMPTPTDTPISLTSNWNWPAYLPLESGLTVPTAFASLVPNVSIVKTQSQSKLYSSTTGTWIGSLTSVNPGQGIKVQMLSADNLVYPSARLGYDTLPYVLQSNGYPDNMILHAQLVDANHASIDISDYDVYIIDNANNVRSTGIQQTADGSTFVYFTIGGSSEDAYLTPYLYNRITGKAYYASTIDFTADAVIGSCDAPVQLIFFEATANEDHYLDSESLSMRIVPNPFITDAVIRISSSQKANEPVDINIFDIRGRRVVHYTNLTQNEISIPSDLSSGLYFVRVSTPTAKIVMKFVKLR